MSFLILQAYAKVRNPTTTTSGRKITASKYIKDTKDCKYVKFPLTMMVVLPPRSTNLDPHINMSENLSPHVSRGSIFSPFQAILSNFPLSNKKLVGILIFV